MASPFLAGEDDGAYYVASGIGAEPRQIAKSGLSPDAISAITQLPPAPQGPPAPEPPQPFPYDTMGPNSSNAVIPTVTPSQEQSAREASATQPSANAPTHDPSQAVPPTPASTTGSFAYSSPDIGEIEKYSKELLAMARRGAGERKKAMGELAEAADAEKFATQRMAAAESEKLQKQYELSVQQQRSLADLENRQQKFMNERTAALDGAEKKIRAAMDDVANMRVDPDRLLNTGDNRTVAAISAALGSFGATISHTQDTTMDMINRMIDRDVDAQKFSINNARAGVDQQRSLYGLNLQRFGEERSAMAATRMQLMENFKIQLEQTALESGSAIVKANAQKAKALIEKEQAKDKLTILNQTDEITTRQLVAGGELASKAATIKAEYGKVYRNMADRAEAMKHAGVSGTPLGEAMFTKAMEKKAAGDQMLGQINMLEKKLKEVGTEVFPSMDAKEAQAWREAIATTMRVADDLGVPSGKDMELIARKLVDDPTQVRTGVVLKQLEVLRKDMGIKVKAYIDDAGMNLIDPRYYPTGAPK